ncbi:hypothetical protein ACFV97_21705 [Streptomyces sp. NPDC059913]|uniref:hypothetical protein n=1 Tax=unclassified Streptomyces TaxID=2593676 RepID=UPI00366012B2
MIYEISAESAPPIGAIRELSAGDDLFLMPGWKNRPDWIRYLAAAAHAMARGCVIHQGVNHG